MTRMEKYVRDKNWKPKVGSLVREDFWWGKKSETSRGKSYHLGIILERFVPLIYKNRNKVYFKIHWLDSGNEWNYEEEKVKMSMEVLS